MQKIWLEHYPPGVPHEIDPEKYTSLADLFEKKVAEYGQRTAYVNLGIQMTYQELEEHSRHFANFLLQNLLLEKGDRIAIMLPNLSQFPVALFGILRAGLIVVNINPLYTPAELKPILENSGVETILVLEQFAHIIEKVTLSTPIKNVIVTSLADLFSPWKRVIASFYFTYILHKVPAYSLPNAFSFRDALAFGKTVLFTPCRTDINDVAFLQYTGGTTGTPKGVMLTHRNLLANIEQAVAWIAPVLTPDTCEVFVTALPLYHIFSLMGNAFVPLYLGAKNILITNPRDTKRFIEEIAHTHFTVITGVNTLYRTLVNHPDFVQHVDCHSLKIALAGGMALQKNVADKWNEITGKPLLEAYGLSETSPGVSMFPIIGNNNYNGSAGLPWPSTEIDIRDETQQSLNVNEIGEIWVRGPQVMKGYWKNKSATREAFSSEGWFDTGDIGKVDEAGFLHIIDRKKDMINISGFNVYPIDIENVISQHPDVLEVGVVGVRDKEGQEIIKACIVRRDPRLTRNAILAHCKLYLTGYKIPKIIEFMESLPKSNVGKVLKRELR